MVDVLQTEWQRFNESVAAELEVLAADARAGRLVAIGVCYVQTGFTWGTYADNVKDVAGTAVMLRGAASTLVHRLHHADMQNMETRVPGTPEEVFDAEPPPVALLRQRREDDDG